MEAVPRTLYYFEETKGRYPYREWLMGLKNTADIAKLDVRLTKLMLGNFGKWRAVGEGVIELKEDFGPGYRIYVAEDGPVIVVILCGGDKSTQTADIKRAKEYWRTYKSRKRGN
ncbi:type II toxin-antitoxin system RelE/ParE family toxin [bacterium]|nr:type II toxin-antitoxin system RelE/ParE family toxin [bacterium]